MNRYNMRDLGLTALACSLLMAPSAHADDVLPGRLFHSPGERAALDGQRSARVAPTPSLRPLAPPRARLVAPERSPELSGFVLRSDGRNSYWLAAPGERTLTR